MAQGSDEVKQALDATKVTGRQLAADVLKEARKELRGTAEGKKALGQLRSEMRNLASLDKRKIAYKTETVPTMTRGSLGELVEGTKQVTTKIETSPETPFEALLKYRQSLDDVAGYNKTFNESKSGQKALKIARGVIKEKLDQRIDNLDSIARRMGGDAQQRTKDLKALNERYRLAKNVNTMAKDRAAGEAAKVNLGLLETITGAGIAGGRMAQGEDPVKAIGTGLVGGIALRQARKYGPGLGYQGLVLGEKLAAPARALGRGMQQIPTQGVVSPWLIMNQGE
jgi:hypothetical protein